MGRVIVIGAGASGMLAAIAAARHGCAVTVLEGMEKPGKKLLLTGSGKCNLTNVNFPAGCYRGAPDTFVETALAQFPPERTRAFFHELGLLTYERGGGIYPVSGQASSVLDILLLELSRLGVKLKCKEKVTAIVRMQGRSAFQVHTAGWAYEADAVILAAGSKAAPATGSDGSGYALAESLGHHIIAPLAALVPLIVKEAWIKKLSGIRMPARITLVCEGSRPADNRVAALHAVEDRTAAALHAAEDRTTAAPCVADGRTVAALCAASGQEAGRYTEAGELQWTDSGISGIAVFQVSRYAARALARGQAVRAELDLLPGTPAKELGALLRARAVSLFASGRFCAGDLLAGMFPKKAIAPLLAQAGISESARTMPGERHLAALADTLKCLRLTVCGTRDFAQAQACQGGVDCREVQADTMESRIVPGLFFAGELLDVDGICGGYNLQWAWTSGYLAGRAASAGGAHETGSAAAGQKKQPAAGGSIRGRAETEAGGRI